MYSIDLMNRDLEDRLDTLVSRLLPAAVKVNGTYKLGSLAGEAGQSLVIWASGTKAGQWFDFAAGEGGDLVGLIRAVLGHREWRETFRWIRDFTGRGDLDPAERRRLEQQAEAEKKKREAEERQRRVTLRQAAKRHWLTGIPIPGTPAERYLLGRNIDLKRLGHAPGVLRYHAAMKCPETGQLRPCMLAMMQTLADPEITIHRTFLEIHADGRVTKAAMEKPKTVFSPVEGAFIPLNRGASREPIRKMPLGEWICITEGIEDALTLALAEPTRRILAAYSLSNIGNLILPERMGGVFFCADNDVKPDAIKGFERARAKLEGRGYRVVTFRPPPAFKDFNEWAQALARRAA